MLFLIFLILAKLSFALNCQELGIRLERVKTYNIYDELIQYSEGLLKNCQENESYPLALDYLLNALETIYQEKTKANSKLIRKVADKRILYSYQQLFHVVAMENRRVGDYEYALKYAYASTQIGRAILQLK
jgi:hypothetical protein